MEAVGQIAEKSLRAQRWAAGRRFPSQRGPRPTQRQLRWHSGAVVPRLIDALVSGPVFPTASTTRSSAAAPLRRMEAAAVSAAAGTRKGFAESVKCESRFVRHQPHARVELGCRNGVRNEKDRSQRAMRGPGFIAREMN